MEWFQQYANKELLPVLNARITRLSRIMPGQKFIELTGLNTTGKTESLTKIVAANKLTLLLIWESTCSHCREEIPLIKKQYDTYKSKGLQIYAVSLDENESNWKKFLEDNNISWINIRLNNASEELNSYVPNQTPVIVMINQQGVIQHRLFNANDLSKHLKSFFSE